MRGTRTTAFIAVGAATLLLTAPGALGASPAAPPAPRGGSWTVELVGNVGPDRCPRDYGLRFCTRPGGLAALGPDSMLVHQDTVGEKVGFTEFVAINRGDGLGNFGPNETFVEDQIGGDSDPALAQDGNDLYAAYLFEASRPIHVRYVFGFFSDWGEPRTFKRLRQVHTNLAIATREGRVALAVAGYDEAIAGRPPIALRVHVSDDAGATYPVSKVFAWNSGLCYLHGTDPSIAVTQGGVIVLAYWKTCERLVAVRSTNGGVTWSAPKVLSTAEHAMGMAIAAHGNEVVLAYTAGGQTLTRHSADRGAHWSAPTAAGSGATSLRLTWAEGAWRMLSGGTDRIRYRQSVNGTAWGSRQTVFELAGARTYAIGVAYGDAPLAAFVVRTPAKQYRAYAAHRGDVTLAGAR